MDHVECTACTAPTDVFLCPRCVDELRDLLGSLLPNRDKDGKLHDGLLDYLLQAEVGQTRLGETGRRVRSLPARLHGDDTPDALIVVESGRTKSGGRWMIERPKYTLNRLLAQGGVNVRAANLRIELFEALGMWARHIASSNKLTITWKTAVGYAEFLHQHAHLVALDEDAGECLHRVRSLVAAAVRVINRPEPPRFLGPCPNMVGGKPCATALEASRGAESVQCPRCGAIHEIDHLLANLLRYLRNLSGTDAELKALLSAAGYAVNSSTWRSWLHRKQLRPIGWVRPDGARAVRKEHPQDIPVFAMRDVMSLMGLTEEVPA